MLEEGMWDIDEQTIKVVIIAFPDSLKINLKCNIHGSQEVLIKY